MTDISSTSAPIRLAIGSYIATVTGAWNGGSAVLERRLSDGRTYQQVETTAPFTADGSQEFAVVPSCGGGPYRLRLILAPDAAPLLDAAAKAADRFVNHAALRGHDTNALRGHVAGILAAAKDGAVADMQNHVTMGLAQTLLLADAVKADPGGTAATGAAEAALRALEPLSGPVLSLSIDPVSAAPAPPLPAAVAATIAAVPAGATVH
jgi:hypothetical protein